MRAAFAVVVAVACTTTVVHEGDRPPLPDAAVDAGDAGPRGTPCGIGLNCCMVEDPCHWAGNRICDCRTRAGEGCPWDVDDCRMPDAASMPDQPCRDACERTEATCDMSCTSQFNSCAEACAANPDPTFPRACNDACVANETACHAQCVTHLDECEANCG